MGSALTNLLASTPAAPGRLTLLGLVAVGVSAEEAGQRACGIVAGWPAGRGPSMVPCAPGAAVDAAERCDAMLVCADAGVDGAALDRLVGELDRAGAATLVLRRERAGAEPGTPAAARSGGGSTQHAVTLPWSAADSTAAGALLALCRLGPVFRAARGEQQVDELVRAMAARQMEQHQHELQLAIQVQREFLPRTLPRVEGVELGALFRPGTALSGDHYDVIRLDEHRLGFLVADACGHGLHSAFLMLLVGRLIVTREPDAAAPGGWRILPPREVLTRLNAEFSTRRAEGASLVSAVYGMIDARTGEVRLASAGHPPPLLVTPDGTRPMQGGGPLLGTLDDYPYDEFGDTLEPGSALLLYSDGFDHAFHDPEAARRGELRPNERYLEVFSELARPRQSVAGPAAMADIMQELSVALDREAGSLHQADDMTLLALRRS